MDKKEQKIGIKDLYCGYKDLTLLSTRCEVLPFVSGRRYSIIFISGKIDIVSTDENAIDEETINNDIELLSHLLALPYGIYNKVFTYVCNNLGAEIFIVIPDDKNDTSLNKTALFFVESVHSRYRTFPNDEVIHLFGDLALPTIKKLHLHIGKDTYTDVIDAFIDMHDKVVRIQSLAHNETYLFPRLKRIKLNVGDFLKDFSSERYPFEEYIVNEYLKTNEYTIYLSTDYRYAYKPIRSIMGECINQYLENSISLFIKYDEPLTFNYEKLVDLLVDRLIYKEDPDCFCVNKDKIIR